MKWLLPAILVALMPAAGFCQETMLHVSPMQAGLVVYAREFPTPLPGVMKADVQIGIARSKDEPPVPTSDIQRVRILDTDGSPIEFTDRNPDELRLESVWSGASLYIATYELVDPSRVHRLGDVRFEYLGKEFVFDMRASGSKRDDEPELRRGREAVERQLTADMTRDRSVVQLAYGHSERHGDEIWYSCEADFTCAGLAAADHDRVILSWNRKTGGNQGRNP